MRELQWSKPGGGTLLGFGRSLSNEQTAGFEFMRIHQTDGALWLTVKAANRPEASFRLTQLNEAAASFAAPLASAPHAFPQRLVYSLEADASLALRLEGSRAGQPYCQQFTFKRVNAE